MVGQQSLADPTRAPEGQHTLWCYSRVPHTIEGGWAAQRERFADLVSNALIGKTVAGRCTRVVPESVTIEEGHNSYCLLDADAAKAATHGG